MVSSGGLTMVSGNLAMFWWYNTPKALQVVPQR
jgi:hypothetical protein